MQVLQSEDTSYRIALALFICAGVFGVLIEHFITNNYLYRVAYMTNGLAYGIVAYSMLRTLRVAPSQTGLGIIMIALSGSIIFLYWWGYSWFNRPFWYREYLWPIFVAASCCKAFGIGHLLMTIGHRRDRARTYIGLLLAAILLAVTINIWGGSGPFPQPEISRLM